MWEFSEGEWTKGIQGSDEWSWKNTGGGRVDGRVGEGGRVDGGGGGGGALLALGEDENRCVVPEAEQKKIQKRILKEG